jgi:predicted secreted protein
VSTPATRVEVQGALGKTLRIRGRTTRLEDILPVVEMVQGQRPAELPLKLNNGSVSIDGTVSGPLTDPEFRGQVAVASAQVQEFTFDRFAADVTANKREAQARNIVAGRGRSTVAGSTTLTLRDHDGLDPGVVAQLTFRNVDLAEIAKEGGVKEPLAGIGTITAQISGTLRQPQAALLVDVQNPSGLGERADRLRASVQYSGDFVQVRDGVVNDAGSEVRFNGSFRT